MDLQTPWLSHFLRRYGLGSPTKPEAGWSDEALVQVILDRDLRAHKELLVARYQAQVYRIVLSVLGPEQDGYEDLTQEILLRILGKLPSFRGDSKFSTWVYRLSFNAALDLKRKQKRQPVSVEIQEESLPAAASTPVAEVQQQQSAQQIQRKITQLPETWQIVIHAHYWLGLQVSEIAELLAAPEGTVKSYLHRARSRLAQGLQELNDVG